MKSSFLIFLIIALLPLMHAKENTQSVDRAAEKSIKKKTAKPHAPLAFPESESEWEQQPMHTLNSLENLLKMKPQQLKGLRTTLQKIEDMPQKERNQMLSRIKKFKKLQRDKREQMVKAVKEMKPEHQNALKNYWDSLHPDAAEKMREKLSTMSKEDKNKWRHSILNDPKYCKKPQGSN